MARKRKDDPTHFNADRIEMALKGIMSAFPWCDTKEGTRYWKSVYSRLERTMKATRRADTRTTEPT